MENRRDLVDSFCHELRSYCWQTKGRLPSVSFHRSLVRFDNFFESSRIHPRGCSLADSKRIPRNRPLLHSPRDLFYRTVLLDVSKLNEMETILTRESNWRALYRSDIAVLRCEQSPFPPFLHLLHCNFSPASLYRFREILI